MKPQTTPATLKLEFRLDHILAFNHHQQDPRHNNVISTFSIKFVPICDTKKQDVYSCFDFHLRAMYELDIIAFFERKKEGELCDLF